MNEEESVKDRQRKCTCMIWCKSMKKPNQFIDINFPLSWASTQLLCPWGNIIIDQFIHSFIHSLTHLTNIEIWAPTTCQNQSYMRLSVGPQWVREPIISSHCSLPGTPSRCFLNVDFQMNSGAESLAGAPQLETPEHESSASHCPSSWSLIPARLTGSLTASGKVWPQLSHLYTQWYPV